MTTYNWKFYTISLLFISVFTIKIQGHNKYLPPLIYYTQEGSEEKVRRLLNSGANVNIQDHEGKTALMKAAVLGNFKILRILLNAGANTSLVDHYGENAYDKLYSLNMLFTRNRWNIEDFLLKRNNTHNDLRDMAFINRGDNTEENIACHRELGDWYRKYSVWKRLPIWQKANNIINTLDEYLLSLSVNQVRHQLLDRNTMACIIKTESRSTNYSPETLNYTFCEEWRSTKGHPVSTAHGLGQLTFTAFKELNKVGILDIPEDKQAQSFAQLAIDPHLQLTYSTDYLNLLFYQEEDKGPHQIWERTIAYYSGQEIHSTYVQKIQDCRLCLQQSHHDRDREIDCLLY